MEPGLDVNVETGLPIKPPSLDKRKILELKRQERAASRYESLINDISGAGGAVLRQITELFVGRINELIKGDPACSAYQAVFDSIGIKVNIGKKVVLSKLSRVEECASKDK